MTPEIREALKALRKAVEAIDAAMGMVEYGDVPDWQLLRTARLEGHDAIAALEAADEEAKGRPHAK